MLNKSKKFSVITTWIEVDKYTSWIKSLFLERTLICCTALNALFTHDTYLDNKPFATILFLFFFKFFIKPGVITESLRGREVFLPAIWETWSVLLVFVGLVATASSISILPKSMSLVSFPRDRMTSKILPRLCPPLPRISEMVNYPKIQKHYLTALIYI